MKLFPIFDILRESDVTYLSSHFHLINFIYQIPSHSCCHSFPSHSFYWSLSITFTFTIFGYTHTILYFKHIASFISHQFCLLKLGKCLDKVLIWNAYFITWNWTTIVLLLFATLKRITTKITRQTTYGNTQYTSDVIRSW